MSILLYHLSESYTYLFASMSYPNSRFASKNGSGLDWNMCATFKYENMNYTTSKTNITYSIGRNFIQEKNKQFKQNSLHL